MVACYRGRNAIRPFFAGRNFGPTVGLDTLADREIEASFAARFC
jgi:hypothetical protein